MPIALALMPLVNLQAAIVVTENSETIVNEIVESGTLVGGRYLSEQVLDFNNNKKGSISAEAWILLQDDLGDTNPETFSVSGTDFAKLQANLAALDQLTESSSAIASEPNYYASYSEDVPFPTSDINPILLAQPEIQPSKKVDAGASTTFSVTFDIGLAPKLANLNLDWTIDPNNDSDQVEVTWELKKNGVPSLGISGSDMESGSINESTILSQGSYELIITLNAPIHNYSNHNKTLFAQLDSVYFEVVDIPEPCSAGLLIIGFFTMLMRRLR